VGPATPQDGLTPLHVAVTTGNAALVREILKNGGIFEATDNNGNNCMHLACEQVGAGLRRRMRAGGWQRWRRPGSPPRREPVANCGNSGQEYPRAAIAALPAGEASGLSGHLDAPARPALSSALLAPAAAQGCAALVKELVLEAGAKNVCKSANNNGLTPAEVAMENGYVEVADLITEAWGLPSTARPSQRQWVGRRAGGCGCTAPLPPPALHSASLLPARVQAGCSWPGPGLTWEAVPPGGPPGR
jgi:ankyrin repeat protein